MTMVESVRSWLKTCPELDGERLNVDFLPVQARSYSVAAVPAKEVVRHYLDGSAVKQFLFTLASREVHGEDIAQNVDNLAFYEALSHWVDRQKRSLPSLGVGRRALKMEVTTSGYLLYSDEQNTAQYQIQLKLTYYEKGER